ncbi:uncharacterized protein K489DRAFT_115448 [Dissoconium aciculare CBS 342.82]|uniref:Metallothionein n=1 Tax=Dissoconium aciculare CBS 342.82 TaxID=1314786 RepID=A0A6J3MFI2_9PEZI|nr:uncharacterized protein K489DRAFT_115448 [Dissoconium aciculare CBS 342.82]KAF1826414.1 hypothetical protein K489DRAFT_115448 [Dissoconium aciculare CBS 342.82]
MRLQGLRSYRLGPGARHGMCAHNQLCPERDRYVSWEAEQSIYKCLHLPDTVPVLIINQSTSPQYHNTTPTTSNPLKPNINMSGCGNSSCSCGSSCSCASGSCSC